MTGPTHAPARPYAVDGLLSFAVTAIAFVTAAELAYLHFGSDFGSPAFWPANGVTLAALVRLRRSLWPWVIAGAVTAEIATSTLHGTPPAVAALFAACNSVEVLLAASLFLRWSPDRALHTRHGFTAFTGAALVIGPAVGAALGATALVATVPEASWFPAFAGWATGDAIGVLVVAAPFIASTHPGPVRRRWQPLEWTVVLGLVLAVSLLPLVTGERPLAYLAVPALVLAALRLGVRGTLVAGALLAVASDYYTAQELGPWVQPGGDPAVALAYLKLFVGVTVITAWLLAVEIRERRNAERGAAAEREARAAAEEVADRLARLRRLSQVLSPATTVEDVAAAWHAEAGQVLGSERYDLYVPGPDGWQTPAVLDRAGSGDAPGAETSRGVAGDRPEGVTALLRAALEGRVAVSHADGRTELAAAAGPGPGRPAAAVVVATYEGVLDADGARIETLGAVTALVSDALERARLFAEAVDAGVRVSRLQELTSRLGTAGDAGVVLETIVRDVRQAFGADAAGVLVLDRFGRLLEPRAFTGPAPAGLSVDGAVPLDSGGPVAAVARRRALYGPQPHPSLHRQALETVPHEPPLVDHVLLPLVAGSRLRGVMWFAWDLPRRVGDDDRAFHAAVADQCAAALRRAATTEEEHQASVKLQQALLPSSFPAVPGMAAAARYVPSSEALAVGGDWYDVVARPDGRGSVVVGDVMGHDVTAAAAMGQLRSAVAAVVVEAADPSQVLERLDTFPGGPGIGFATLVCLDYDAATCELRYSCAGHPPPLLVQPDGEARFLMEGRSTPLFAMPSRGRHLARMRVQPGSILVCYTDGLIERPGRSLYDGMTELARAGLASRHASLSEFTSRVLDAMTGGQVLVDDVALLCVTLSGVESRGTPGVSRSLPRRTPVGAGGRGGRRPTRA